jgi:hypothetical protein
MRPVPLLASLLSLLVGACSSSPTEPTVPPDPSGTVLVVDEGQLKLRDASTGAVSTVPGSTGTLVTLFDGQSAVRGIDADGDNPAFLEKVDFGTGATTTLKTFGTNLSFLYLAVLPDRSGIAFVLRNYLDDGDSTLHLLELASGNVSMLWPESIENFLQIEWLPDGQRMLAETYDGGSRELVLLDFRGGAPTMDTIPAGRSRLPGGFSLSPDGRSVVFTKWIIPGPDQGERHVLHSLNLSTPTQSTSLGVLGLFPMHDPSGKWVAYTGQELLRLIRPSDLTDRPFPGLGTTGGGIAVGWF